MSLPVASPRLLIDEAEVDLGSVWIHRQDDPYPGGHRYRLWLPESLAAEWLANPRIRDISRLDGQLTYWRWEQGIRKVGSLLFVLNTMDKVTRVENSVEIQGECSPHCATLNCPYCGALVWANWLFDHCVRGNEDRLRFMCPECSKVSNVTLSNDDLSLSSLDGNRESTCRQFALKHEHLDGIVRVALGKLTWEL